MSVCGCLTRKRNRIRYLCQLCVVNKNVYIVIPKITSFRGVSRTFWHAVVLISPAGDATAIQIADLYNVLDKRLQPTAMLYVVGPISAWCFNSGCQ